MSATIYQCSPDVRWVVETFGILIVDPARGACCSLPYPAAAVWDLLSRGHSTSKITTMMQYIGGFPDAGTAESYVADCLLTWANAGWLRRFEEGEVGV